MDVDKKKSDSQSRSISNLFFSVNIYSLASVIILYSFP